MSRIAPSIAQGFWSPALGNQWGRPRYPSFWNGCVGAWAPLLGVTGQTLYDWSGLAERLSAVSYSGSIWQASGFGHHLALASPTYFQTASTFNLVSRGVNSGTFAAWIKTSSSYGSILDSDGFGPFQFRVYANKVELYVRSNDSIITSTTAVNDGNWHLVVATHNHVTGLKEVWIDGRLDKTQSGSAASISNYSNQPLILGESRWGGLQFTGSIAESGLWHRVLSPSELSLLACRPGIMYEVEDRVTLVRVPVALAYTAAASLVGSASTLSAYASVSPPSYTATADLQSSSTTLAASASHTAPTFAATADLLGSSSILAASAAFTAPTFETAVSLVGSSTALAASASHTTPTYAASAALVTAASELEASASFDSGTFTASAALTSAASQLSASATVTPPVFEGTVSLVGAASTLAASASFDAPTYEATATLTSSSSTLAASAAVENPAYTATVSLVGSATTLSATARYFETIFAATFYALDGTDTSFAPLDGTDTSFAPIEGGDVTFPAIG